MQDLIIIIINFISTALFVLFIARMVFGFARVSPYDPTWGSLMRFVFQVTEPILAPVRRIIPSAGGLDFSPMIVLVGLSIIQRVLLGILN